MVIDRKEFLYESPCWDDVRVCTWFVDVYRGRLLKLEANCIKEHFEFNSILTSVNICKSNRLILTSQNEIFLFDPETFEIQVLQKFFFENQNMRLNDCKVSDKGELIFSYFEDKKPRNLKGSIGIFVMSGSIRVLYENLFFTPNGIAFDGANQILWCADTGSGQIYQIDLKQHFSNNIRFGSEVINVIKVDPLIGRPDGGNLDALGNYWVALHGGGRVGVWNPSGEMIGETSLFEARPTMVCFSGVNLDQIDVTFKLTNEEGPVNVGILRKPSGATGKMTYKFWDY